MRALVLILATCLVLAACGKPGADTPTVRISVDAAPAAIQPIEAPVRVITPLSAQAESKVAAIRAILTRNSLARLVRLADAEPAFISNFAGEQNRVHWDLLRRTGFDPLSQLETLLNGPYATRTVGDEVWYIWPDLAALDAEALVPERLSFSDRARLLDLVGETGIARIRAGQGYPGIRTAITQDGRWLYFVHESEDEAAEE